MVWLECDQLPWCDAAPGGERKMGGSCDDRSTPLRIVLGTFSDGLTSQSSNKTDGVVELSAPIADGASVESPTTYILGTSYFATPSLGSSNSNSSSSNRRLVLKLNKDGRVPMEDRKGSFSQFKPKSLLLSVSYLFFCVCSLSLDMAMEWLLHTIRCPANHLYISCIMHKHINIFEDCSSYRHQHFHNNVKIFL